LTGVARALPRYGGLATGDDVLRLCDPAVLRAGPGAGDRGRAGSVRSGRGSARPARAVGRVPHESREKTT